MTWIEIILVVAVLAIAWLILYLRGVFEPKVKYCSDYRILLDDPNFLPLFVGFSQSLLTQAHISGFWSQPDQIYAVRIAAIRQAQHIIQFETFFMTPGTRANEFADALIERAIAGVRVEVLADHSGTLKMSSSYWKQLREAGIEIRFFHPPRLRMPLQYLNRTHRKLLIIDGTVAFTGGMGVSDDFDGNPKIGDRAPWFDCEIRLENNIVPVLVGIFRRHWLYEGGKATGGYFPPEQPSIEAKPMLVVPHDADSKISSINALIWFSLQAAQQRIWIASPYFILDLNTRTALIRAKKRGVDVRVVTTSARNDKHSVYYAVRERYRYFLPTGIEIYEYQPSMIHAKLMLVDQDWISFGSANFDPRSFYHNDELNLAWFDPDLASIVEKLLLDAFEKSKRIEWSSWRNRPWWQKLIGRCSLLLRWQL
ncbi:cardiolipin synthase B [Pseudanabaenaceae cyanobacterium LEGE 13415]|nr:cardiolipin synthase B [Pseudanabaenaceae cyanobacterium LEGE 13415]